MFAFIIGFTLTILVCALVYIVLFNQLVRLRTETERAWKNIDVQLQRRYDLIPNLVETVKQYASHEKTILDNFAQARTAFHDAINEQSVSKAALGDKFFHRGLTGFNAVAEQYPDLKASTNFLALQEELVTTENQIAYSRDYYNSVVRDFNNATQTFPSKIVATLHHFPQREFYRIENDEVRKNPQVKDLF